MTRKHPHVALFLAASAALAMSAMPPSLAAPEAAASGCQAAPKGLVENSWLGGSGSWSDATKWSQQVVPGLATRDYACLPHGLPTSSSTPPSRGSTSTCWTSTPARGSPCSPGTRAVRLGRPAGGALGRPGATPSSRSTGPPSAAAVGCRSSAPWTCTASADRLAGRAQPRGPVSSSYARAPRASSRSATRASSTSTAAGERPARRRKYVVDVRGLGHGCATSAGLVADHGTTLHAAAALLRLGARQAGRPQRR